MTGWEVGHYYQERYTNHRGAQRPVYWYVW